MKPTEKHPPLNEVTSPNVNTAAAAYYLNRKPQTLRIWAAKQIGSIQPQNINGRLAWSVAEIKKVAGVPHA